MTTEELRIGNLVKDHGETGEVYTVSHIGKDRFTAGPMTVYPAGLWFDYGIPLTEEWLLKFGFEVQEDLILRSFLKLPIKGSNENRIQAMKNTENNNWWACATTNGYWSSNNIEFVHQLQNLYFALTGSELELKSLPETTTK